MLEPESRGLLLVALALGLSLALPTVAASEANDGQDGSGLDDPLDGARDQARDAAPDTGSPADDVVDDLLDPETSGPNELRARLAEDMPETGTKADGVAHDAVDPEGDPEVDLSLVEQARDDLVRQASDLARMAWGLVPHDDPMDLIGREVEPLAATATGMLPTSDAYEVTEPEPASGEAVAVSMDVPAELIAVGAGAAAAAALVAFWIAGSSSGLAGAGAGASGASSTAAGAEMRRLLPFASPLFTRFEKDTVLGHPKREALYALILQDPGVSLQALCDKTGLSRTAVTHHLRLLELQHLIVSKRMGRSRHYYENGGRFGRDQKDAYAILHNGRSKDVARFVRDHPGAIQKEVCAALGIQPSIAHWHLKRLHEAQLVEPVRHGRTVSYFPGAALKGLDQPGIPRELAAAESSVQAAPALPAPMPAAPMPPMPVRVSAASSAASFSRLSA